MTSSYSFASSTFCYSFSSTSLCSVAAFTSSYSFQSAFFSSFFTFYFASSFFSTSFYHSSFYSGVLEANTSALVTSAKPALTGGCRGGSATAEARRFKGQALRDPTREPGGLFISVLPKVVAVSLATTDRLVVGRDQ
eukprot:GHVT01058977.1.p1 GENE.GHVT01058977.1~~GHVT01058977.1.p1  ORF type:complete len:137 (+),score=19.46 GHVT01058977.1:413-823(+)